MVANYLPVTSSLLGPNIGPGNLNRDPFEPLESVPDKMLNLKVALLLALISLKKVEDIQALSVASSYLDCYCSPDWTIFQSSCWSASYLAGFLLSASWDTRARKACNFMSAFEDLCPLFRPVTIHTMPWLCLCFFLRQNECVNMHFWHLFMNSVTHY